MDFTLGALVDDPWLQTRDRAGKPSITIPDEAVSTRVLLAFLVWKQGGRQGPISAFRDTLEVPSIPVPQELAVELISSQRDKKRIASLPHFDHLNRFHV